MTVQHTIDTVKEFCLANSGNENQWSHKGTTYQWNLGREAADGEVVNGVVRKLEGKDAAGKEIWTVAGSLKISPTGKILRFTGLGKKIQKTFSVTPITVPQKVETV